MKVTKITGALMLPIGVTLALTGCSGSFLKPNATPSPTPTETKAPTFSAEQQEALKLCLSADDQKALQPDGDADKKLIAACQAKGQGVYDSLTAANKNFKTTADLAAELKTTTSVARATFIAHYMDGVKEADSKGVTVTDSEALAAQIRSFLPNANQDDVLIGSNGAGSVDKAKHTIETGGAPFYHGNNTTYLDSTDAIAKWFAEGSPEALAAKDRVTKAIKDAGKDDKEVARAISGAGYIPIQLKDASQILGTSYYSAGNIAVMDQWRQSQAGDIYWLYITEDGKLVPGATLRADCGNVGATVIRIVKVDIPQAVPVGHGPGQEECPPGTDMQPNGECHTPPPTNPPVCTQNCQPGTPECTTCLEEKVPAQDPYPRGNAGNGGGQNADPGPGTYIPRDQMQDPPSTPYTAPAAPAPQPAPVQQGGNTVPAPTPMETPRTIPTTEPNMNPAPAPGSDTSSGEPPANTTKPTLPADF